MQKIYKFYNYRYFFYKFCFNLHNTLFHDYFQHGELALKPKTKYHQTKVFQCDNFHYFLFHII